jgi:mono/diheme cytochrome c family protein
MAGIPLAMWLSRRHSIVRIVIRSAAAAALIGLAAIATVSAHAAPATQDSLVARGKYLATTGLCNDCHTPGYFLGKPDQERYLGGSDVGFELPGLGVFVGRNITPDDETGIGKWSEDEIVTAMQTGVRPDGRVLAPIMPWHAFAELTKEDVTALARFLKSLKPVKNQVPGPFGPGETVPVFMFRILPPGAVAADAPK